MHQPHDLYLLRSVTSRLPSAWRPDAALLRPGARDSGISQKVLAQQLRQLGRDGIVARIVHPAFGLLQAPGLAVRNLYRVPGPGQDWQRADPVRMTDFPESGLFLEDPQISRDGKQLLYARGTITGDVWILKRGQ